MKVKGNNLPEIDLKMTGGYSFRDSLVFLLNGRYSHSAHKGIATK